MRPRVSHAHLHLNVCAQTIEGVSDPYKGYTPLVRKAKITRLILVPICCRCTLTEDARRGRRNQAERYLELYAGGGYRGIAWMPVPPRQFNNACQRNDVRPTDGTKWRTPGHSQS